VSAVGSGEVRDARPWPALAAHAAGEIENRNDFESRYGENQKCGGHKKNSFGLGVQSVPAGEFGQINGQPPVVGEVVELDLAKESSRDRRGRKSPRAWVAAEVEAGYE